MKTSTEHALAKVPEVTLGFWPIKIAATTLGETGGDAVSMSMNLGYLVGTGSGQPERRTNESLGHDRRNSTCSSRYAISRSI